MPRPIEENFVTPNTVDVRLVPESDIPVLRVCAEHAVESVEAIPGIDEVWSGDEELQKEDEPNDALQELAAFMGRSWTF